jgi:decaprenylphospho-beta-D-ribofuranose 2-oxidase
VIESIEKAELATEGSTEPIPQPSRHGLLWSFDGGVSARSVIVRPDRYRDLERLPRSTRRIVRGGGYSYAAASFGGGAVVQDFTQFDRILGFDADAAVVRCEAGITLGKLFAFAHPRGLYLPVQPGHPDITVGGCIAADSHGKNPAQDGTFRRQVVGLTLYHPSRGLVELSPERSPELFELTCGGYGLTGHIVAAALRLSPVPAATEISTVPVETLTETVEVLAQWSGTAAVLHSWNDLSSRGDAFGRGFVSAGTFLPASSQVRSPSHRGGYLRLPPRAASPVAVWRRATTRPFNVLYGRYERGRPPRRVPIFDLLFPIGRRATYFRFFGRRGFHECQFLIPVGRFDEFAKGLQGAMRRFDVTPTLGSCKWFAGEPGLLRFDGKGVSIAVDFPRDERSERLAEHLDDLVRGVGGIPNVVKDSRLPRQTVEACFPGLDGFRGRLRRADPERLYRSELSDRLGL